MKKIESAEMYNLWELQDGKELAEKIAGRVEGNWDEAWGVLSGARITNLPSRYEAALFLIPNCHSELVYNLGGPDDIPLGNSVVLLEKSKVSFVFPETWPLRGAMGENSAFGEFAEPIRILTISPEGGIERASIVRAEASEVLKEASRQATARRVELLLKSNLLPAQDKGQ